MARESTFQKDTSIEPGTDGAHEASLEKPWWVEQGPNGGYVAAILARVMAEALEADTPLRSISVRYLKGADPGAVTIDAEVERAGRTVSSVTARMVQDGSVSATGQATFGASRDGLTLEALSAPDVPGWDHGMELPRRGPLTPPTFTQHVDYRIAGGDLPLSGAKSPEMRVWMRAMDPTLWEDALVVFLSDAWMPAAFAAIEQPAGLPTIDLTVHLTGHVPGDPQEPVLGVFTADQASDGFVIEDGDLWTVDGRLVARMRQLRRYLEL